MLDYEKWVYNIRRPPGHQAVGAPLNSFRCMFLIHQAFQPPVFCLILQSSVLQYSILQCPSSYSPILQYPSKRYCRLTARPPLAKIRHKDPALGLPSRPGGGFSATPLAFCASESQKHIVKCTVAIFTPAKHSILGARMAKTHNKINTFAMKV